MSAAGVTAVVTGVGMITPLGLDAEAGWARILAGESAARTWPDLVAEGFPVARACRVDGLQTADQGRRGRDLAGPAAREALVDAGATDLPGLSGLDTSPERVGIYVGTTMGESAAFEAAAGSGRLDLSEAGGQVFATTLAREHGLRGPARTYGTACAAGNYAIGAAARAVRAGRVDVALAGGVEPFSRLALLGFARMRATAPDRCRPFAAGRRGMMLGEAAAFLVVEAAEHAERRGAHVRAVVGSLGLAADAHHPTAPREDGSGMAAAMRAGLTSAGVQPADVGWVSAHGTGTPRSDAAEALALRSVFGADPPPVSSVKGAIGHSLGAATAVEAVLGVLALEARVLPPNTGLAPDGTGAGDAGAEVDPVIDLDVVRDARDVPALSWVMSCGYAFGGLNSALLLGRI